jgi:outer membrane protein assembly factor BamB
LVLVGNRFGAGSRVHHLLAAMTLISPLPQRPVPPPILKLRFVLASAVILAAIVQAGDWPQFLGPTRDGLYAAHDLADTWSHDGPHVVWQKDVGQGFSGPVVASGKVIVFHRLADKEIVECLDAQTGRLAWTFDYPTAYHDDFGFDEGPRATPAVSDGRVYTYGAEGVLHCLDSANGTNLWTVDAKTEFHAAKGFFGIACSPLVEGNAVLLIVGGPDGAGIVAFDKGNGKVLWKATDDEASYSSPVAATIKGRRYGFFFTRAGLVAADPASGKVLFRFPFRPPIRDSVSAATPLIVGDSLFLSASYGAGALLLKIADTGLEKLWAAKTALSNHYATSVYHDGFLYGIDGRTDPGFQPAASLRCVELATGRVRWQHDAFGAAVLTLAADQLLILTEKGELIRAPASPEGFKPNARAQVLRAPVRAHPALANGLLYARDKTKLVCLDLRRPKGD